MTPPAPEPDALAFLAQPALTRLWTALRSRLERNGLQPTGTVRLTGLDAKEREALSLLLGKSLTRPVVNIRLADLDTRLRESAVGRGLVATAEQLGPPLTDHRAEREAAAIERTRLWNGAADAVSASPLAGQPWAQQWLDDLRRGGAVARQAPHTAAGTLGQAVQVLSALFPGQSRPVAPHVWGRGELATRATGSAHGLDDGTLLSRLVLRGIALAHGIEPPTDAAGRRAVWRLASVAPDEISSTVLTHGLRPAGDTWGERNLRERADRHLETHLTQRELRLLHFDMPPRTRIHICENPRIVEAAADAASTTPLICTSGSATTVVLTLLDTLAAAGCTLAYHGDFDWPGIALANRIIERYDAASWRMEAADYEYLAARADRHATPQLPLSGTPIPAIWDAELAPAMQALGVALHEEAALNLLIEDLG